jgi:hypothetical protein
MLNPRRFAVLAVTSSLFAVAAGATLEQVDLPKLLDPATREAEVTEILARRDAETKKLVKRNDLKFKRRDFRLVSCPQASGREPLHLLLVDYGEMIFNHPLRPDAYKTDDLDELFPS